VAGAQQDATEWCAALDEPERSLEALRRWSPSVLLVHGVADPVMEARLLAIAPAVFVAHTYTGTCISSRKTLTFPRPRPCDRVFGPACLALFYPRRCGGLHPLTLIHDYRRQTAQLGLIQTYSHVLTMSQHMRREYVRHGVAPHRAHALPPYLPSVASSDRVEDSGPSNVTTLLFVGRIERLKGCRLLIEALPGSRPGWERLSGWSLQETVRTAWPANASRRGRGNPSWTSSFAAGSMQPTGRGCWLRRQRW
jgi:glycosyltransferase involved in cell wall biosynthesis